MPADPTSAADASSAADATAADATAADPAAPTADPTVPGDTMPVSAVLLAGPAARRGRSAPVQALLWVFTAVVLAAAVVLVGVTASIRPAATPASPAATSTTAAAAPATEPTGAAPVPESTGASAGGTSPEDAASAELTRDLQTVVVAEGAGGDASLRAACSTLRDHLAARQAASAADPSAGATATLRLRQWTPLVDHCLAAVDAHDPAARAALHTELEQLRSFD